MFLDLRQNERFFPEARLHPEVRRHVARPFPRQGDFLTLPLYERLADAERLCAPLVFGIII